MSADTGWSTRKMVVLWAGIVTLALIVTTFIVLVTQTMTTSGTERLRACLGAGNTAAECGVALR